MRKETFKVRFGQDYTFEFKYTHHGVMLYKPSKDDLGFSVWFPLEFLNQNNELQYSMRWVYSEGYPTRAYQMTKELVSNKPSLKDVEVFMEAQNMFPLNMMFVTSGGDIGYHMSGMFPKRKYNVHQGVYPKKGWLKENLWQGFIDPKEHPRLYNPESGFIVSANNFVASKNCKHGLSHAFSFTTRFLRVKEMFEQRLAKNGKLTIQDMIDAQLDTHDIQARESLKYILQDVDAGMDSALKLLYGNDPAKMKKAKANADQAKVLYKDWNYNFELE